MYIYIYTYTLLTCSRSRHQSYESLHSVLSYSYSNMYYLMIATIKAETCSCSLPRSFSY